MSFDEGRTSQSRGPGPLPFERKVVGVGLGRTGTMSLFRALNCLAIPTVHYVRYGIDLDRAGRIAACRRTLAEFQGIANGTALPYHDVDPEYPGSKFILTVRDEEGWLDSKRRYAQREDEKWGHYSPEHRAAKRAWREQVYGSFAFDADAWLASYRAHLSEVRSYFRERSRDLLEMDIAGGDGWPALCEFLGVPTPPEPFPRVNTWEELDEWSQRANRFWQQLEATLESGETCLLVDDGRLPADGRNVRRFGEVDGTYQGKPESEEALMAEVVELEASGVRRIVFAWDSFWWLEHYNRFRRWLDENASVTERTEELVCYELDGLADRGGEVSRRP